jgi:hypothetical protein
VRIEPLTAKAIRDAVAAAEVPPWDEFPVVSGLVDGFPRAALKATPYGLSEMIGHQIAVHLGVRVPRLQAFWVTDGDDDEFPAGSVGVLVEHLSEWRSIGREDAATLDPEIAGRALALCAFDRFEWGQFGVADWKVYFLDLERTLPPFDPVATLREPELAAGRLKGHLDYYLKHNHAFVAEPAREARALGVYDPMEQALRELQPKAERVPLLELSGHPAAEIIRPYADAALRGRLDFAVQLLSAARTSPLFLEPRLDDESSPDAP